MRPLIDLRQLRDLRRVGLPMRWVRRRMMQTRIIEALSIAPNLFAALALGTIVGLERQLRNRHTGMTTHALVALGAATFTTLGALIDSSSDVRMGGQVATGIGFLGAGLIMRDGGSVRGLSTAATVWATGAIGMLAGYGFVLEAAELTAFILLANVLLPRVGLYIESASPTHVADERYYAIEVRCNARDEALLRSQIIQSAASQKLRLHSLESRSRDEGHVEVEAIVSGAGPDDQRVEELVGQFSLLPHILLSRWTSTAPPE